MISADLLLKGLAGTAAVAGAATMAVFHQRGIGIFAKNKVETFTLEQLADKVGLVCKGTDNTVPTATVGVVCSKKEGTNVKVNVKKDSKFELDSLGSTGKIKVYKTSADEKYNNDHKFVIEGGDISGTDSNKLEEFETYEIKKEGDDWRLTRKDKASVLKGKLLGLSGVDTCKLPEDSTEATCSNLTSEDLKKIKFDGKQDDGNVTIETSDGATTITLKISKFTEAPFNEGGYKFVLETNKNISIPKSEGAITIKKGTNTEFKLKTTTATGGGAKTLTLEKAWSLDTLRVKAGIDTCTAVAGGGNTKECSFSSAKVNLFIDAGNHTKGASVKSSDGTKKIKVEEDQENHNQGFKFYAEENSEITLENGTPTGNGEKKIEKKVTGTNSPTYEIKEQTPANGTKDWYLSKKTAAN